MRIGILTTSYPRHPEDWAGTFVAELAKWLAEHGDQVEVIAPSPAVQIHAQVPVVQIAYASKEQLFFGQGAPENLKQAQAWVQIPRFLAAFMRVVQRRCQRWDAIISHWLVPSGLVAAIASTGRPHLAIAHGSDVHFLAKMRAYPLCATASAVILHAIAQPRTRLVLTSESLRSRLLPSIATGRSERLLQNADVCRMGIPSDGWGREGYDIQTTERQRRFRLRTQHHLSDRFVVLALGRLIPLKGISVLIEACEGLEHMTLVVAGDGPERQSLMRLAASRAIDARFLGELVGSSKHDWFCAADLFVFPSIVVDGFQDSAPLAVLEAMAARLPVVASDVGGNGELIQHGTNGILFPAQDMHVLRHHIVQLMSDASLRRRLAREACNTAKRHSWESIGTRFQTMIAQL